MSETIRIFIGTEPKTHIACQVLKHSVRRRTAAEVEFVEMIGPAWEVPADLHQGTGFSLRRFMIPAACGYEGRAIYLDADQLVLADIQDLWDAPDTAPGAAFYCTYQLDKFYREPTPQTSVMVIECDAIVKSGMLDIEFGSGVTELFEDIAGWLRAAPMSYPEVMHLQWPVPVRVQRISTDWNSFNRRTPTTKLLHYTREHQQPWYFPSHPEKDLWRDELLATMAAGMVTKEEIRQAVLKWSPPSKGRRAEGMHPYWEKFAR